MQVAAPVLFSLPPAPVEKCLDPKGMPQASRGASAQPGTAAGGRFPPPPGWARDLSARFCAAMQKSKKAPLSEAAKDLENPEASWNATPENQARYRQHGIDHVLLKVSESTTVCAQRKDSEYFVEGKIGERGETRRIPLLSVGSAHGRVYRPKADFRMKGGGFEQAVYRGTDGRFYYRHDGKEYLGPGLGTVDYPSVKGWYVSAQELQSPNLGMLWDQILTPLGTAIPQAILHYFN